MGFEGWEGLTLANCAEGRLEEQFQDHLAEAFELLDQVDEGRFELGKDKVVPVTIKAEVRLELDVETRTLTVGGRVTGMTRPKRRLVVRAAAREGGAFLVEKARQEDLIPPVRSLPRRDEKA